VPAPAFAVIGVLIVAHDGLGQSLRDAVVHVLGAAPPQFDVLSVGPAEDPGALLSRARGLLRRVDTGEGVLVLCDLYGATPCNVASRLAQPGRVELVSGVNLPMLVRAFTYRREALATLVQKALSGGCDGMLHVEDPPAHAATRR
jgi:PTS system ascorbate-specific IIA component